AVGEVVDDLEVVHRADTAAPGDDALRTLQVRAVAAAGREADIARVLRKRDLDGRRLDCRVAALAGFRPRGTAHRGHHYPVGRCFDGHDGVTRIDRALEGMCVFDGHDVGDLRHAQQRGNTGHQVLAEGGTGAEHVAVTVCQFGDLRSKNLCD